MSSTAATTTPITKGQQDTTFKATIKDDGGSVVDISGAATRKLKFLPPGGSIESHDASFTTDGTDGVIEWKDTDGEATDVVGIWKYWAEVIIGTDGPYKSTTLYYEVVAEGDR